MEQTLTLPNGRTIHYHLEHRPRRTVGLKITHQGLVVHAPKRIFTHQLNQILLEKSQWIVNKLAHREANQVPPIAWQHGEQLLYLGHDLTLEVHQNPRNKTLVHEANRLIVATPTPNNPALVARKVVQWYQKQAMQDFARRLEILSAKLGVPKPSLLLSNARSRWGSCNSRGEVRLNWRLLQAPPSIINYVICHELSHLKEMNHSPKFYAVLESLFPNYKAVEKELKLLSPQLHRMG
jgi:predicted metal-dependent hydrolase